MPRWNKIILRPAPICRSCGRKLTKEQPMSPFLQELNEPQRQTIERLRQSLKWSHYTNVVVRKDGQDWIFEADWLRKALDLLCREGVTG